MLTSACLYTVTAGQIFPSHPMQRSLMPYQAWSPDEKYCRKFWAWKRPSVRRTYPSGCFWGQTYFLLLFEPWQPCDMLHARLTWYW